MKRENQKKIYFITGNVNKFQEVKDKFNQSLPNYELIMKNFNPIEIQAKTLEEVALFKLHSVRDLIEGSYFIEDAGLFVDVPLSGFPGVYSSYVFKTIGNEGILKLISDFETSQAHFEAVIALFIENAEKPFFFRGVVKGQISNKIRGMNGFGFDPIFKPEEIPEKTFGEITQQEKNTISHRAKALDQLIRFLKERT